MEHDLKDDGVPQDAIIRFDHHAGNTKDEAAALRQLILQRGWKRILLVTFNYHTRRARYICARTFPPGTGRTGVPPPIWDTTQIAGGRRGAAS